MHLSASRTRRRRLTPPTLFVTALLTANFARAADERHYVGPANGNWNDPSHWSAQAGGPGGAGVPAAKSLVFIDRPDTTIVFDGDYRTVSKTLRQLSLDGNGGTLFSQSVNALTTEMFSLNHGRYVQAGGLNHILSRMTTADGDYRLSGGALTVDGGESVGFSGGGGFVQTGGAHTATGGLSVGYQSPNGSSYSLSGGTLTTGGTTVNNARFVQAGGSHATGSLALGSDVGPSTYLMSGGTLAAERLQAGSKDNSSFMQTQGAAAIQNLTLGGSAGSVGEYRLDGGALTSRSQLVAGSGAATFTQTGGANKTTERLYIGEVQGAQGKYVQTGGSNFSAAVTIAYSEGAEGTYSLQGGTLTANVTNNGLFEQAGGNFAGRLGGASSIAIPQQGSSVPTLRNARGTFHYVSGVFDGNLDNSGAMRFDNDFRATGTINNGAPWTIETGRTIGAGGMISVSKLTLAGGTLAADGGLRARGEINVTSRSLIRGDAAFTSGKLTSSSVLDVDGTFTMDGSYVSHGGTLHLTQGTVTNDGVWILDAGDQARVDQSLKIASTKPTEWDTTAGTLVFTHDGGSTPTFSLPGFNRGRNPSGFIHNFSWGRLELEEGVTLILQDANVTPGGAVYVRELALDGGVGQANSIIGNGLSVFYDPTAPFNAYLGGQSYPLIGGGVLGPINVPEPASLSLLGLGAAALWRRRGKR